MYQFITSNWHTLLLIYLIGCVATFILMLIFFRWIAKAEDEERELYPDAYSEIPTGGGFLCVASVFLSFLMAILWVGTPVIFLGVWVFDIAVRKFPNLMGGFGDDEESEDNE